MGADGGSLPSRREQVKTKQQQGRNDPLKAAQFRLTHCSLTGRSLDKRPENIAVDAHGNLFDLESVLEALLDADKKKDLKSRFGIRKIKDVTMLKANMNPDYGTREDSMDEFVAPFVCPFSQELSNGTAHFVALRRCGHVISHRSMKELTSSGPSSASQPSSSDGKSNSSSAPTSATTEELSPSTTNPLTEKSSFACVVCHKSNSSEDVVELASITSPSLDAQFEASSRGRLKKRDGTAQEEIEAAEATPDLKKAKQEE